jgi:hypothetical protein
MKIYITLCFSLFFTFSPCLHAFDLNEKSRTWTREDGKTARGKLVDIVGGKISLEVRGKVYEFSLSDFSEKDKKYVKSVMKDLPRGNIEEYPPQFRDEKNKAFFEEHAMRSLVWRGERGQAMPLMVYQPLREDLEKLPVIIYLHGTGGMGTGNTKPFFKCGGGAAKHLLAESFQKKSPCIVITEASHRSLK